MPATVEDDMLPDFVANRDGVELGAEARQELERRTLIDDAAGIERVVEDDRACPGRERGREVGFA